MRYRRELRDMMIERKMNTPLTMVSAVALFSKIIVDVEQSLYDTVRRYKRMTRQEIEEMWSGTSK